MRPVPGSLRGFGVAASVATHSPLGVRRWGSRRRLSHPLGRAPRLPSGNIGREGSLPTNQEAVLASIYLQSAVLNQTSPIASILLLPCARGTSLPEGPHQQSDPSQRGLPVWPATTPVGVLDPRYVERPGRPRPVHPLSREATDGSGGGWGNCVRPGHICDDGRRVAWRATPGERGKTPSASLYQRLGKGKVSRLSRKCLRSGQAPAARGEGRHRTSRWDQWVWRVGGARVVVALCRLPWTVDRCQR